MRLAGVFAIIQAVGWPIWPLLLASVIAVALIIERSVSLRRSRVVPAGLLDKVLKDLQQHGASAAMTERVDAHSPLGRVLAAGLRNVSSSREVMKESIEEAGRAAAHELDRFLTTLGTIATMSPLLGLLGTIIGMIEIFGASAPSGMTNPAALAHGISIALYNAAFGIIVAVPSLVFYRHFRARADALVVEMELQAVKLVEVIHGERAV